MVEHLRAAHHHRDYGSVDGHQHVVVLVRLEPAGLLHVHDPSLGRTAPHLDLVDRDVDTGELEICWAVVVEDHIGV